MSQLSSIFSELQRFLWVYTPMSSSVDFTSQSYIYIRKKVMPKLFNSSHIYKYQWDTVACAYWQKYPHVKTPQVLDANVLDRYVDPETGFLHTTRVLTCDAGLPRWLIALGFMDKGYVAEYTTVDPKNKTIEVRCRNLTCEMMKVEESCRYSVDANDSLSTLYTQNARITVKAPSFNSSIESFSISNYGKNSMKGKEAMEMVCSFVEEVENEIKWKMKEIEGQLKGGVEDAKDKMGEIRDHLKEGVEDAKDKMTVITDHFKEEVECKMKGIEGQLSVGGLDGAKCDDVDGGGVAAATADFNRMAVVGGSMAVLGVSLALLKRF